MVATRSLPIAAFVALAAASALLPGCTTGTTPVCDDAGSCLILPPGGPVDGGLVDASAGSDAGPGSDASHGGDAAAE
jgi:hypothetical protein